MFLEGLYNLRKHLPAYPQPYPILLPPFQTWPIMRSSFSLLVALVALFPTTQAATWYFLRYNLPSTQSFLSFSGTLAIPKLPKAGIYYL
jgi:hypothetical protein